MKTLSQISLSLQIPQSTVQRRIAVRKLEPTMKDGIRHYTAAQIKTIAKPGTPGRPKGTKK